MKLFLASWFAGSAELLPDFAGEGLAGKRLVFIPTAARHKMPAEERAALDHINALDKNALLNLGFIVEELEVSDESCEVVEQRISAADAIFVCGGSTFFLLQELKRKGADKLIANHIKQGKLYMGTSAGSLLVQKDIIAEEGVEDPALGPELNGDTSALGLVDFYMYVHYGSHFWGDDDECYEKLYAPVNAIKISDKQAVTLDGEKVEVVTAPGDLAEVLSWLEGFFQ